MFKLTHIDKQWNANTKSHKERDRKRYFAEGTLFNKWTDRKQVKTPDQFANYEAIEDAILQSPILIFEMIAFIQELEDVGITPFFIFPGHAAMVRFFKQRFGGYQNVPEIIHELDRFKDLYQGKYNVFDRLENTKIRFYCPTQNMDGMNRFHRVNINDGPLSEHYTADRNKFDAYFGHTRIDTFDGILLVMTSNRLFPIR